MYDDVVWIYNDKFGGNPGCHVWATHELVDAPVGWVLARGGCQKWNFYDIIALCDKLLFLGWRRSGVVSRCSTLLVGYSFSWIYIFPFLTVFFFVHTYILHGYWTYSTYTLFTLTNSIHIRHLLTINQTRFVQTRVILEDDLFGKHKCVDQFTKVFKSRFYVKLVH